MAVDGVLLNACKTDMKDKIIGARVNKIYQMGDKLLTLQLRQPGENFKLLVSIDPQGARAHLTDLSFKHPSHPPDFCMLLRKYLINANIYKITQPEFERVLNIFIEKGDKIYILVLEIMGRYSNVILINENKLVLDAMKRIGKDKNSERQLYPGITYKAPPPQDKLNPLKIDRETFFNKIPDNFKKNCYKAIMYNFRGIGPNLAREIVHRAGVDYEKDYDQLYKNEYNAIWKSFKKLFARVKAGDFCPSVGCKKSGKIDYTSAFPLKHKGKLQVLEFENTGDLFDYYYENHIKKRNYYELQQRLSKVIDNYLEKNHKKQRELKGKLIQSKNAEKYKKKGELIKANLHQIKNGQKKVKLIDYYDPEQKEITIELNPDISPIKNAQKYFRKYEKSKKSYDYLKKEWAKFRHEEKYLKQVKHSIRQAENEQELREIEKELSEENYIQKQKHHKKDKQDKALPPHKYKSTRGYDILVGRNNRQNDRLTKKVANSRDLWFHTKKIPGSHVIVRNHTGDEIPEETIREAAQLAAYYSQAHMSTNVPVDYTTVKNVNKPRGAKPGLVHYENYQTLYVDPDPELIKSLKKID